jgi:predicted nuclease of predicted toxin-antitoxin system
LKLLFDEDLAPSLVTALASIYPASAHVRELGLKSSPDTVVWDHAANTAFCAANEESFLSLA